MLFSFVKISNNGCTTLTIHTKNSAIADKSRHTFRGKSRSPNMVPFHMLRMVSYTVL